MPGIIGEANIQAARTTFQTVVETGLARNSEDGLADMFADRRDPESGLTVDLTCSGALPVMEQREGSHEFGSFRVYNKKISHAHYQAGIELPRPQVLFDKSGTVENALSRFQSEVAYFWAQLCIGKLAENPTGIDGVSILNDSHPFGASGGTWDNLSDGAITFDRYDAAQTALANLRDEFNGVLGLKGDLLICNPTKRRAALEVAMADDRPVAVGTDSTLDSGGIGATGVVNVYKGDVTVVTSSRMGTNDWVLIDSRYKPVAYAAWTDPQAHVSDDMSGDERMERDVFRYSVECDAAAEGFQPWGAYGYIA